MIPLADQYVRQLEAKLKDFQVSNETLEIMVKFRDERIKELEVKLGRTL